MPLFRNPGLAALAIAALLAAAPAQAQQASPPVAAQSVGELARKVQNPIGDLVMLPVQNNANFDAGPHRGTQNSLNLEPIVPFVLNDDWSVVTRTVLPLLWQPSARPARSVPFGTGPITFSAFLSPRNTPAGGWTWRVGPVLQIPAASNAALGSNVWGAGPSAVVVRMQGPWVYGGLFNNVFSFGGTSGRSGTRYSTFLLQPFMHYNFAEGWSVGTVPMITANWLAGGEKWTLPLGGHIARVVKLGGMLPVNLLLGAYYNVLRPQYAATWQLRTQVTLIF